MRQRAVFVVGLSIAFVLCACGGDPPPRRRNGVSANDPFSNPNGASGTGAFSNAGNGGAAGTGAGGASVPLPPLDPMAPPFVRDDTGMSGLPQATIDQLKGGGGSCAVSILYPYENTVFPGGLEAPVVMWDKAAEGSYVRVAYDRLDSVNYEFASAASDPGELQIPRDAWNEITRRTRNTALKVTLSTLSGGVVSTCETTWKVAPGVMTGALYYNTYSAPGAMSFNQGAVMRMKLGQSSSEIYLQYPGFAMPGTGPCVSCHSVSANGSTIVASTHDYSTKTFDVASYPLTPAVQPPETTKLANAVLGALTPDGSRILTMGNPDCTAGADTFPRSTNNFPLVEGPDHAKMLDTKTGQEVPAPGLSPDMYMWMPQFSPTGDKIVFNNAHPDGSGGTQRRELAIMDYDYASNTFSNLRVIVSNLGPAPSLPYSPAAAGAGTVPEGVGGCTDGAAPSPTMDPFNPAGMWGGAGNWGPGDTGALNPGTCEGPCYPAYPFFTPDGKGVVFSMMSEPDFTNAFPGRDHPAKSELWYVDLESGEIVALDNINNTLNPADRQAEYFPTVLPIQVGGYYWVFWTTRRAYGHRTIGISGEIFPGLFIPPELLQGDANKKRIWVAAIKARGPVDGEVQAVPGALTDPSFPGFYLAGQSESGNVRAFATLNPCASSGSTCTSGLDCCGGFCNIAPGALEGACTEEVPECANTNERCTTSDDCCPPTGPDQQYNSCIGGFCGFVQVE